MRAVSQAPTVSKSPDVMDDPDSTAPRAIVGYWSTSRIAHILWSCRVLAHVRSQNALIEYPDARGAELPVESAVGDRIF